MLILFCVVGYSSFSFFFFWDSEDLCVTCISPDIHMTGFEAFSPSGPHPSIVTFCMVWTVAAAAAAAAARCLSSHFHFSFFSLSRLSPFARLRAMAGNSAAGRLFVCWSTVKTEFLEFW